MSFWIGFFVGIIFILVLLPVLAPKLLKFAAKRKLSKIIGDANARFKYAMNNPEKINNMEEFKNGSEKKEDRKSGEGTTAKGTGEPGTEEQKEVTGAGAGTESEQDSSSERAPN